MQELKEEFDGKGEVSGWKFRQIKKTDAGYVYERTCGPLVYYEVFRRKVNHIMESRGGDAVISYPKSKSFGRWAWMASDKEAALRMLDALNAKSDDPIDESGDFDSEEA